MSSHISKLICKIVICDSSHIVEINRQSSDPTFFRKMNHRFLLKTNVNLLLLHYNLQGTDLNPN
ncbi:hypothetical protein FF021_13385 [Leptospira noguchii]|nr:hypothetical protein FF021_13385 [Leptospira noguchii]